MFNDVPIVQEGAASGVTYNIGGNETFITFNRYVDGSFDSSGTDSPSPFDLTTVRVDAATTPEPSAIIGLLAVSSIGALTRKRK